MQTWAMTVWVTASGFAAAILPSMRPKGLKASFLPRLLCGTCTRRSTFFSSTDASFPAAASIGVARAVSCRVCRSFPSCYGVLLFLAHQVARRGCRLNRCL